MSEGSRRDAPPADFEVAGSLRAAEARWQQKAQTTTITNGAVESEKLREREPENPDPGRTYRTVRRAWHLRARLVDAVRRQRI
jgi:hypothetical protein